MLIVTTDRLSAFDVVLPDPIPGQGRVLNGISNFWFAQTRHLVPNHLTGRALAERGARCREERALLEGRAVIVQAPAGAADRGGGARLPDRLGLEGLPAQRRACAASRCRRDCSWRSALPQPLFTPATKAALRRARREHHLRRGRAAHRRAARRAVRDYRAGALPASPPSMRARRGIIIADTKFEFGVDGAGALTLMDEVLTPDSSRFWPADTYRVGHQPAELRQAVRARLSGDAGLEQEGARTEAAGRDHRAHQREVSRSARAADLSA